MTAIRSADGNVVQISKTAIQDRRLSLSAHGLLACMLSYPAGTVFTVEQLDAQTPEGHREVGPALRELEGCGYYRDGVVSDTAVEPARGEPEIRVIRE